jgi:hypothetical protein
MHALIVRASLTTSEAMNVAAGGELMTPVFATIENAVPVGKPAACEVFMQP